MSGDIEMFHDRGWHNRIEGEAWVLSSHYLVKSAIRLGRVVARERGVGHIVKNMEGAVAEKASYRDVRRHISS